MPLIHKGIRPTHQVVKSSADLKLIDKPGLSYEIFPDDSYKIWTDRTLNSGCNNQIEGDIKLGEMIYCEYCDEFFNRNQFEEIDGGSGKE